MTNTESRQYETAGYSEADALLFEPGPSRCGDINDGVLFEHVEPHHWKGCWLVSFADLQDMYFRAANERHMSLEHVGRAYLDFLSPPKEATHD